jgi:23S rRNA (adenine1618-N6)-methyltransferase
MGQGNKTSRIIAWTFLSPDQQRQWVNTRWNDMSETLTKEG